MTAPTTATLPQALAILAETAEVGGESGMLGGPVGVLIGVGLGLTTGGLILLALEHADKDHSDSKPGAVEECPNKSAEEADDDDIECFRRPAHVSKREFERNVEMAQAEINRSPPDEFLKRLDKVKRLKDIKKGTRTIRDEPENRKALEAAWEAWKKLLEDGELRKAMPHLADVLLEDFPKAPLSPEEARASVEREWGGDNPKRFHHMAHRADIVGGGRPNEFGGPVDLSINTSIGAQWSQAKLDALRKRAEKAKREGKYMNVQLKICPETNT